MTTVPQLFYRRGPGLRAPESPAITVALAVLVGILLPEVGFAQQPPSSGAPAVTFHQVAPSESGITWVHENAMSDERHLPETVGAGCAFFDYDNDGWMDIYLVNSGPSDFYKPKSELRNALYRNNRDGTFTDVTEKAGVAGGQFGMGVAAADYDGDGDKDLYVTSYDRNLLYRNNGDGTFTEVAEESGLDIAGWFTHAVWFDSDNDSDLDLFASSFVSYILGEAKYCGDNSIGRRHYCIPRSFKPTTSRLFQNNGTGKFIDVSEESGITSVEGKAFGAVATDINNDGYLDLFVANDTVPNFLFVNQGDGTFEEEGLLMGVAYSDAGNARSGMGVDATDYDGDLDVLVSNNGEPPLLLRNDGGSKNNWIGLQLKPTASNPEAVGAIITWESGGVKRYRLKTSGGSYLASHDPREILGLGDAPSAESIEIQWPSGKLDQLKDVPVRKYSVIVEGKGVVE